MESGQAVDDQVIQEYKNIKIGKQYKYITLKLDANHSKVSYLI